MNDLKTPDLSSFGNDLNVAVCGASGGLGGAFVDALTSHRQVRRVIRLARSYSTDADARKMRLDIESEDSIAAAARTISKSAGNLDLIIVATGILHDGGAVKPEKTWRALSQDSLERLYRINAIGPALIAKHFLPLLGKERKSAFAAISARVGSIEDNRLGGWHAYRMSKAALNMAIKTLAIELALKNTSALCVGLHPGTVDTRLSKPFQANVQQGQLFSAQQSVGYLLDVINRLTIEDSGNVYAWDGALIPG
jgi:NAD(P)-dependent dehydrogenase (short-subunit alcohol dehydrogenase family)